MLPLNYDTEQNGSKKNIIDSFLDFLQDKTFPCVSARAAAAKEKLSCLVVDHMTCPKDDHSILHFLYHFVDAYRSSKDVFSSAAIIFEGPLDITEELFDMFLWKRLQAISNMDAANYSYDQRVDADPTSPNFSFSIKEEAFFIIGMHPASSRAARRFMYPTLVFNPHAQFEELKRKNKYDTIRNVTRKRDIAYSGSVNPMLDDFGRSSEAKQYSGREYNAGWKCPFTFKSTDK
ncbi:MAG: guanitoxin biosynthesis heme-dependent pre-guanitoxin N-hydroxylase GntA [Bacteroidota bacterium]